MELPALQRFWLVLNERLDAELGGSFVNGFRWSAKLATEPTPVQAPSGEQVRYYYAVCARARACV